MIKIRAKNVTNIVPIILKGITLFDPDMEMSQKFFATVQNKMHWAAHGQTAAEIIVERADASKPHMGLTSWTGNRLLKADVTIAKNYLNHEELETPEADL